MSQEDHGVTRCHVAKDGITVILLYVVSGLYLLPLFNFDHFGLLNYCARINLYDTECPKNVLAVIKITAEINNENLDRIFMLS